jgi:hypothetical protein
MSHIKTASNLKLWAAVRLTGPIRGTVKSPLYFLKDECNIQLIYLRNQKLNPPNKNIPKNITATNLPHSTKNSWVPKCFIIRRNIEKMVSTAKISWTNGACHKNSVRAALVLVKYGNVETTKRNTPITDPIVRTIFILFFFIINSSLNGYSTKNG